MNGRKNHKKTQKWSLLYANARGIKSKMPCIKNVFAEKKPDIALFTETHLSDDKGMNVDGYTWFGKARKTGKGGGVGIFVKNEKKSVVAPHYTQRDLEITWVSINRNTNSPLFVGVYYGKQETTCNKATINDEMVRLTEEILEMQREGEVIICMDANAKVGLMGEEISRNGGLISAVFEECEMNIINGTEKCEGLVTRQNRKKKTEQSAIDLVVTSYQAQEWVTKMIIDESGDFVMSGKNESDHNTILIDIEISHVPKQKQERRTVWNVNASEEKYDQFKCQLSALTGKAEEIMANKDISITDRYSAWEKLLYKAAISTIGKTTVKPKRIQNGSEEIKSLRKERRELKKAFETEKDKEKKKEKMEKYIRKQQEVRECAVSEESERVSQQFEKMKKGGVNGFWNLRKRMKKDDSGTWLITKDEAGNRIFDPQMNKDNMADYYEGLHRKREHDAHPYHREVEEAVQSLSEDTTESEENDHLPSLLEVKNAIMNKKNGKSTTDWKNEMIKKGGNEMVKFIYPVIRAFWEEGISPKQWNFGLITNVFKGKGDRELMKNHRGITVSSAIGTIVEEIIYNRMTRLITFTQSQAGGRKGGSTTDHVFTLKNMISICKKEKRNLIITFYDVVKAYDKVDMQDMCYSMYKNGVDGKLWRLMRAMNVDLTAKVKTKVGLTREIQRETGGKQGGKLMVPLFAKMMDNLAEDLIDEPSMGITIGPSRIPSLLYMDDAMTFAENYQQQQSTLDEVHNFSKKHKLEWGREKCKVMEVGSHKEEKETWRLGDKDIDKCENYKYLGEIINRNGKNDENFKERCNNLKNTVCAITTFCRSDVMKKIAVRAILKLHEAETMAAFLYNAETWTVNKTEGKLLEKTEIYALKRMIGLPQTTPTAGIIMTLGTHFTTVRIDTKRLLYLHKVLQKDYDIWARTTVLTAKELITGWAKEVNELLEKWELEKDWLEISKKTYNAWKGEVMGAAEKINKEKILEECEMKSRGETRQKTKTKHVVDTVNKPGYSRKLDDFVNSYPSIIVTRALIMGRYGMLSCANNFSNGYGMKNCDVCNVIDNEEHRINDCEKWKDVNRYCSNEKIVYSDIFSDDKEKCLNVVDSILSVWDLNNGKNDIRKPETLSGIS